MKRNAHRILWLLCIAALLLALSGCGAPAGGNSGGDMWEEAAGIWVRDGKDGDTYIWFTKGSGGNCVVVGVLGESEITGIPAKTVPEGESRYMLTAKFSEKGQIEGIRNIHVDTSRLSDGEITATDLAGSGEEEVFRFAGMDLTELLEKEGTGQAVIQMGSDLPTQEEVWERLDGVWRYDDADGSMYFLLFEKNVYGYNFLTGTLFSEYGFGGPVETFSAVDKDTVVFTVYVPGPGGGGTVDAPAQDDLWFEMQLDLAEADNGYIAATNIAGNGNMQVFRYCAPNLDEVAIDF